MKDKILTFIDKVPSKPLYILACILLAVTATEAFLEFGLSAAIDDLFLILFIILLYHANKGWNKSNKGWERANINTKVLLDIVEERDEHIAVLRAKISSKKNKKLTKIKAGSK